MIYKKKSLFDKVINFGLNTPKKYWWVFKRYHFHKAFLGFISLVVGLVIYFYFSVGVGIAFSVIGILLIIMSIAGNIYTERKPYLNIVDKVKNNQKHL